MGIATAYVLFRDRIPVGINFPHLFRPTVGPTQPPVQWVPVLTRGQNVPGSDADTSSPSSTEFMEEYRYTSNYPLGHTGPVRGMPYILKIYTTYRYVNTYIHIHTYSHKYIDKYMHKITCCVIYKYTHINSYIHTHTHIYIYVHIYIQKYIRTYIRTYTYTHTYIKIRRTYIQKLTYIHKNR